MSNGIQKAMIGVMRDIGAIGKDKVNQQQRFNFRGIDDVYNHLHNIMAKHGVFTTSEILDITRSERPSKGGGVLLFVALKMRYTFHAEDASTIVTEVVGEGMDSGDKATNKAMAIAHKYALLQAFMVPTEDMIDPDSQTVEAGAKPRKVPMEVQMKIQECMDAVAEAENKEQLRSLWDIAHKEGYLEHVAEHIKARKAQVEAL